NAGGRVQFDDATFNGIGEDAAQQALGSGSGAFAAGDIDHATRLPALAGGSGLALGHVAHHADHIGAGQVDDQLAPDQRLDVPVDPAAIGGQGGSLFRATALAEDQAFLGSREIVVAEFGDGDR